MRTPALCASRACREHRVSLSRQCRKRCASASSSLPVRFLKMSSIRVNRRIVLVERPAGLPSPLNFARDDQPVDEPTDGQFLVRNLFLSIDPAQAAGSTRAPTTRSGPDRRRRGRWRSASSKHRGIRDRRRRSPDGWFGWQDLSVASEAHVLRKVNPATAREHRARHQHHGNYGVPGIDRNWSAKSGKRYWSLRRQAPSAALSGRSRAVSAVMLSG